MTYEYFQGYMLFLYIYFFKRKWQPRITLVTKVHIYYDFRNVLKGVTCSITVESQIHSGNAL